MTNALLLAVALVVAVPQGERVPDAAIVGGVPQGMFVGRSLLTGRAVCLLFLSGGRITRFIPEGGLEHFDWNRHCASHGPDCGSWQMRGGQLIVAWGDGGVHQGPIAAHPDGIEFYGKRYAKAASATLAAIAGRWESARGSAIAGGNGITRSSELVIHADGRYQWIATTGGLVQGRAVAGDRASIGTVSVSGSTIVFRSDSGTTSSYTFLPVAGQPVNAFSVDADMFTRAGPATPVAASPPPASSSTHMGVSFVLPPGWDQRLQQGHLVAAPARGSPDAVVVVIVFGAERLMTTVDEFLRAKMASNLGAMKIVQSAPPTRASSAGGALSVLSAGRTVQDSRGAVMLEIYYAVSDGQRVGLAMVAATSEAALKAQMPSVQSLFESLRLTGSV